MTRLAPHATVNDRAHPLAVAALDDALRATDPAVLVVPPRIVRRVIKQDAGIVSIGLRVPHRKTYTIDRDALLDIVDRDELDLPPDAEIPPRVILIARPTAEMLADLSPRDAVVKYWRLLFHARVHIALEQRIAAGRLDEPAVRQRIAEIGATEFEEIRSVLRQEDLLLPPRSDRSVYVEFVAVYLELRYFVPSFLRSYFPALEDFHRVDELLRGDVDGEALLTATRPPGASDPTILAEVPSAERVIERLEEAPPVISAPRAPASKRSRRLALLLTARADRSARLGNQVRSAITRIRAARIAPAELSHALRDQAREDIERLVERLQAALGFSDNEADEWHKSLNALLDASARGVWTSGARALYDLQKVCVDNERGIYTLDVFGWVRSLGRKPLKRFLPGQRDVLISKHLRGAERRLPSVRLTHRSRSRLSALLRSAVHRAEANLRARFKPVVERALDNVKLLPINPPERVARKKLVDEILDRIVERGFLSMGDFRDALSRNNLKLPDLASTRQFLAGDQLLRADRQLADHMDGVYRGGAVYLRFPQRLSSLAFGTPLGRFLTRYVVLPFGGAFLILEGLTHLVTPIVHAFGAPEVVHFMNPFSLVVWGLFLLGLIHYRQYREQFVETMAEAGRLGKRLVIDVPVWIVNRPVVQWIVGSRPFRLFRRYALKPLVITALIAGPLALFDGGVGPGSVLAVFAVALLVLNTRIGRNVDELVTDWVVSTWHRIRIHVFAALFRFIMDLFNRLLEAIERFLYTVDEWLRFRAGERTVATVLKATLGSVWFFVNYVIRFCVTLMVEPQVNPIKHFPVVTVSHKLLLGLILAIHQSLVAPLGNGWAWVIAVFLQLLFPGMFGFLVWELKENWRLYAANRPPNLRPVPIGHHGETMIQFLHPGFRSGTLPKIYAKLRKASRKAYWTQNWKACGRQLSALHEVSEAIRRFVDRELTEVLHESRTWAGEPISAGEIRLGLNRIVVELYCPELSEDSMYLAFSDASGWLVAGIHKRGWSDHLSFAQRHALASALAGFYKMAGVDLVREQIEANLEPGSPGYEITDRALVVWPAAHVPKLAYRLRDWPTINDDAGGESFAPDRDRWVFAATDISWRRWVVTWELDQLDGISQHAVIENTALLPR